MSRRFNGTTDFLRYDAAIVTAVPVTMACWFRKRVSASATYGLMVACTSVSIRNQFVLRYANSVAGNVNQVQALTVEVLTSTATVNSPLFSEKYDNIWVHCGAVFSAVNNRIAYFNGIPGAAQTTTRTPTGITRFSIGANDASSLTVPSDGSIADAAVWNTALTTVEMFKLSTGVCPTEIRPANLLGYWPIFGADSPEPNRSLYGNLYPQSLNGTPMVADDPPTVMMYRNADMIRQLGQQRSIAAQAAPPGGNPVFNAGWNRNNNKLIGCGVY